MRVRLQLLIDVAAAAADGYDAFAGIERTNGPKVDCSDQALAGEIGRGGLVDHDLAQDFGGELVELDLARVIRRGLLAAVEGGDGEIRAEAADRDDVGAALGALRRNAGQAGDRLADAVTGQP